MDTSKSVTVQMLIEFYFVGVILYHRYHDTCDIFFFSVLAVFRQKTIISVRSKDLPSRKD